MLFIVTKKLTKQQEDEKEKDGGKEEEEKKEEEKEEGKFPYAWTCSCSFHRSEHKARTRTVEIYVDGFDFT